MRLLTCCVLLSAVSVLGCDPPFEAEVPVETCRACPEPNQVEVRRTCTSEYQEVTDAPWEDADVVRNDDEVAAVILPGQGCFEFRFTDPSTGEWTLRGAVVQGGRSAPSVFALQEFRWFEE